MKQKFGDSPDFLISRGIVNIFLVFFHSIFYNKIIHDGYETTNHIELSSIDYVYSNCIFLDRTYTAFNLSNAHSLSFTATCLAVLICVSFIRMLRCLISHTQASQLLENKRFVCVYFIYQEMEVSHE